MSRFRALRMTREWGGASKEEAPWTLNAYLAPCRCLSPFNCLGTCMIATKQYLPTHTGPQKYLSKTRGFTRAGCVFPVLGAHSYLCSAMMRIMIICGYRANASIPKKCGTWAMEPKVQCYITCWLSKHYETILEGDLSINDGVITT